MTIKMRLKCFYQRCKISALFWAVWEFKRKYMYYKWGQPPHKNHNNNQKNIHITVVFRLYPQLVSQLRHKYGFMPGHIVRGIMFYATSYKFYLTVRWSKTMIPCLERKAIPCRARYLICLHENYQVGYTFFWYGYTHFLEVIQCLHCQLYHITP